MSADGTSEAPFGAVRRALRNISQELNHDIESRSDPSLDAQTFVRTDPGRVARTGVPEVVLAGTKTLEQVVTAATRLATANGRVVVSRCPEEMLRALPAAVDSAGDYACQADEVAMGAVVVANGHPDAALQETGGRVGIVTAGTSDARAAAEAALIATEMGCDVSLARDVGVAGLHRLVQPLERMTAEGVDALIVAAGMDGALPSVVGGLVGVPVIGLPTSVGYGMGGAGEAALLSMLQSCATGLLVVNIDNGIGAGAAAARIANLVAAARQRVG